MRRVANSAQNQNLARQKTDAVPVEVTEAELRRGAENCSSESIDVSLDGLDISSADPGDSTSSSCPENSGIGANPVEDHRLSDDADKLELGSPTIAEVQG